MTRVLHLRNSDRFGGPERLLLDQALFAGPDVEVGLASFGRPDQPHPFLDRAHREGATVFRVPQSGSYDPRTPARIRSLIAQWQPDVVVAHDYKADVVLALAARERPRVAVVHGYTAENLKIRFFEAVDRRVLKGFDALVVVSEVLANRLAEGGVPPELIHVVSNGIHADRVAEAAAQGRERVRTEWGLAPEDVAILALGRLSPEKGQDVLVEAFASLDRQDPRLVVVGDGASQPSLRARARDLGIASRVTFAGWRDDPGACLGAADVFVLPSRSEGLPLALLEAMAAETPAIATDVGAVREVLADGQAGCVVAPDDAPGLARAIADVLEAPDAAAARVGRARDRVRDVYGIEAQVRRLERIYASVATARG